MYGEKHSEIRRTQDVCRAGALVHIALLSQLASGRVESKPEVRNEQAASSVIVGDHVPEMRQSLAHVGHVEQRLRHPAAEIPESYENVLNGPSVAFSKDEWRDGQFTYPRLGRWKPRRDCARHKSKVGRTRTC